MGGYASLNQNLFVMADPTPVDVDHAVGYMCAVVLGVLTVCSANYNDPPTVIMLLKR